VLLRDFRALIRRQWEEIPPTYRVGVVSVEVSSAVRPHPERDGVYTLGECIPLPGDAGPGGADLQTRIVLYHGSFAALAEEAPGYDWVGEGWETLTHELRHHLEWKAQVGDLEAWDEATEHNFARHEGGRFDPLFYLAGLRLSNGAFQLEDDVFFDRQVEALPGSVPVVWRGRAYAVPVPAAVTLPAFLTLKGVIEPPPGDLVLVLRRRPSLGSLFRRRAPYHGEVAVHPTGSS